MKKISALFLLILLCFAFLAITTYSQVDASSRERWEYGILSIERQAYIFSSAQSTEPVGFVVEPWHTTANRLGEQGWELAQVVFSPQDNSIGIYFKRKIQYSSNYK